MKMNLKEMMSVSAYQFNRLDIGTRMAIVKKLEKIGNKRIEALRKSGLAPLSNALHSRSGKKFNTRMPLKVENIRKSRKPNLEKRLLKSFGQAKSFLGAKSSTIKGAQRIYNRASKDFGGIDELNKATRNQLNKFWKAYNNLRDLYPNEFVKETSDTKLQELWSIMVTPLRKGGFRFKSVDDAVELMKTKLDAEYKKNQGNRKNEDPTKYFDEE